VPHDGSPSVLEALFSSVVARSEPGLPEEAAGLPGCEEARNGASGRAAGGSRIEPLKAKIWRLRVRKVLELLEELGSTPTPELLRQICLRNHWSTDRARHTLAAAHPLALEHGGVWYLAQRAPSRSTPRTRRIESGGRPRESNSEREKAKVLGLYRRSLRYRRDREGGPLGTYACGVCGERGHTRPTCPRRDVTSPG